MQNSKWQNRLKNFALPDFSSRLSLKQSQYPKRRRWEIKQQRKSMIRITFVTVAVLMLIAIVTIFLVETPIETTPLIVSGNTITVQRGGNLQAAINRARPGDTIILEAGAEFVGSFELPYKEGDAFITIQSSAADKLPKDLRVKPENAALMPKILSPGKGQAAFFTSPKAHNYRIIGLEIASKSEDYIYNMISLGSDDQKFDEIPKHFEFDRCYVHAQGLGKARRGFALNNIDAVIKNSHISGFAGKGEEAQAICGWNGPGPFKIINNYVEGGAENIMFGGSMAQPGMNPADLEFRHNHVTKPLEWRGKVTVKNLLELKDLRRGIIEENVFENNWVSGQGGTVFVLTPASLQSGPDARVEDITFRSNYIQHAASAIGMTGTDYGDPKYPNLPVQNRRVKFENNLFADIGRKWGDDSSGKFLLLTSGNGPDDLTFNHNTAIHDGTAILFDVGLNKNLVFTNNIVQHNTYGIIAFRENAGGHGSVGLSSNAPNSVFKRNIMVGADARKYPDDNFYPATFDAIGFSDASKGIYSLSKDSKYKAKGTDGKDIGCDYVALKAMSEKVRAGVSF
ncbi:MAG: hypothetical protein H7Z37_08750 [Pyrinomonadaceae bacterium]|nr:hypothetical protein [Pyrinomonadaceae bacterium]